MHKKLSIVIIAGVITCCASEQIKEELLLQAHKNQLLVDQLTLILSMQKRCENNSNINQQFLCDLQQEKERILKLIIPAKL